MDRRESIKYIRIIGSSLSFILAIISIYLLLNINCWYIYLIFLILSTVFIIMFNWKFISILIQGNSTNIASTADSSFKIGKRWIRKARESGYADDEIKDKFSKAGWTEDQINKIMKTH